MRAAPSAGRTFAGIVIAILTVTLTVVMLPFALCFGMIAATQHQYGSVALILLVQFGVPVLGLFTCVRLLRGGPQLPAPAAGVPVSASLPQPTPPAAKPFTAKPAEFQQFRGALLAFIFISALLWVITTFFVYRGYPRRNLVGTLLYWVVAELPYLIALYRNWKRADPVGIALAACYPVIAIASTVISILPLLSLPATRIPYFNEPVLLLTLLVGLVMEFLLIAFAWRAVRHTGETDEVMLYASVTAGSLVYFFALHSFGVLLFRI